MEEKLLNRCRTLATNKNLLSSVENQTFREDLFYRINVINIELLHLEKENDIIYLSNHFLSILKLKQLDNLYFLHKQYNWPGNVRELKILSKCFKF